MLTIDDLRDLCRAHGLPGAEVRETDGVLYILTPRGCVVWMPSGEPFFRDTDPIARLDAIRRALEHDVERHRAGLDAALRALGTDEAQSPSRPVLTDDPLPCGHPAGCVRGEGLTHWCGWCEAEGQRDAARERVAELEAPNAEHWYTLDSNGTCMRGGLTAEQFAAAQPRVDTMDRARLEGQLEEERRAVEALADEAARLGDLLSLVYRERDEAAAWAVAAMQRCAEVEALLEDAWGEP